MNAYPQARLLRPAFWKGSNLNLRWVRQLSQWVFLFLWYYTFFRTYVTIDNVIRGNPVPDLFLRTDPLAGILSSTAARAFSQELLWWLPMVGLTILTGRGFCGWICPLGTWIDLYDHIVKFWNRFFVRVKCKLIINRPQTFRLRMNWKFYILITMVTASFFSISLLGYLDPLCVMVRAFSFSINPWFSETERVLFGKNFFFGYGFTAQHFFNFNVFGGLFFLGLLSLNRFYRRFWCRVLCPLGALLGVIGKVSAIKISIDPKTCTSCLKCVVDCKMGAIDFPDTREPVAVYRKEECIQCYICVDVCPHDSVKLHANPRFWQQTAHPDGDLWKHPRDFVPALDRMAQKQDSHRQKGEVRA